MVTHSDILAANCESTWLNETQSADEASFFESGTWTTHDSKLSTLDRRNIENPNLKNLEVEDCTSANDLGRIFVSTIDTDIVKSKSQDKEDVPDHQKQLTLLNLSGGETSTNAQDAQVEKNLFCAGGCTNLIPDAPLLSVSVLHTVSCTSRT